MFNFSRRRSSGRSGNGRGGDPPASSSRTLRRISLLATPRSSSSEDEDEEMYAGRSRRMRPRIIEEAGGRSTRSRSSRLSTAAHSNPEGQSSFDGIRRSTRKRNLKCENVNDSWIVGAQAHKGYPDYDRDFPRTGDKDTEDDEDEDEDEEEPEEPRDDINVEENAALPRTPRRILRLQPERRHRQSNQIRRVETSMDDQYQDMYARVKQRRRANKRQNESSDPASTDDEDGAPTMKRRRGRVSLRAQPPDVPKYSLRKTKPTVQRFQIEAQPLREVSISRRMKRRRRSPASSSSSSSSSSDERDRRDRRKKSKRLELVGAQGKKDSGKMTADAGPIILDQSIRFNNIGGLETHISSLKEMILFPILYPEIFNKFGVTPPKGVLFHGPPGTGKTLMARALANECSQGNRKMSFFMRKGADVLSKWVGESERQLRLLFDEAHQGRPSIIFFDELDGLAPVRSSKQDQIHSSIVCTLLALMDGLDNRGDIIIIGATNRIDSIDPALRRPGRFDRELHFPLPGVKERREILGIHAAWAEPATLNKIAEDSAGYCGSDLKALCTESVINSLKRVYPQIYTSTRKLLLDSEKVKVSRVDFEKAMRSIVPSAHRSWTALGRKMPPYLEPLLGSSLAALLSHIGDVFPMAFNRRTATQQVSRSPRLLLIGDQKATSILSSSLLYKLEHCPVVNVTFDTLHTEPGRNPEEVLKQAFKELPHRLSCILWFGDIALWWENTSAIVKATLESLLTQIDPTLPILYLGTSQRGKLSSKMSRLFENSLKEVHNVPEATEEKRRTFFRPLFRIKALKPPPKPRPKQEEMETLIEAPPTPPPTLTADQLKALNDKEETTLRELRIFLRQICAKLARNKQFYMFSKPVDVNEVPDYLTVIARPMDLVTMMTKIDQHEYTCAQDFLNDIDLLCANALEYNPDRDPSDKQIRHRACYLRDTAYALIKAEMDSDFEETCRHIRDDRARRSVPAPPPPPPSDLRASLPPEAPPTAPPPTFANTTRRRRRGVWQRGLITKPKKLHESPGPSGRKSGDSQPSSSEQHSKTSVNDSVGTSSPHKSVAGSEDAPNDGLNGYASATSVDTDDENADAAPKEVLIDRKALNSLLETTVDVTGLHNTTERLVDLHGALSRVLDSYRHKWDRTQLLQGLREELEKFQRCGVDDDSATTTDGASSTPEESAPT